MRKTNALRTKESRDYPETEKPFKIHLMKIKYDIHKMMWIKISLYKALHE